MSDSLQTYQYSLSAPEGKDFGGGDSPDLTPRECLELGVFGGNYFENEHSEFPDEWFAHARLSQAAQHDTSCNYFDIDASQSREQWQSKGWIHDQDPRGWFQWYCRYYIGRRSDDDARQISRWKQMRRHVGQVKAHCAPGDELCRRRQRQALLHWAYDSRQI